MKTISDLIRFEFFIEILPVLLVSSVWILEWLYFDSVFPLAQFSLALFFTPITFTIAFPLATAYSQKTYPVKLRKPMLLGFSVFFVTVLLYSLQEYINLIEETFSLVPLILIVNSVLPIIIVRNFTKGIKLKIGWEQILNTIKLIIIFIIATQVFFLYFPMMIFQYAVSEFDLYPPLYTFLLLLSSTPGIVLVEYIFLKRWV